MKYTKISLMLSLVGLTMIATTPTSGERIWNILAQTEDIAITTDSKFDTITLDFTGVFTALQEIDNRVTQDVSKLDEISIATFDPFIFTTAMLSKLEITQSLIAPIESSIDSLDDCIGTAITQENVGTTGFSITTPGRYFLAENITFSPASDIPVIDIDADEVFFDLGGFTITQGNTQLGAIGIVVQSPHRNIVITNGTIRNMLGGGILTNSGDVSNLILRNLTILNAGIGPGASGNSADGIECLAGTNLIVDNIICDTCQDEGLDLTTRDNGIVMDSSFSNCRGTTGGGLQVDDGAQHILITDCIAIANKGSGFARSGPGNNPSNVYLNCQALTNDITGFDVSACPRAVILHSVANGNGDDGILSNSSDQVITKNLCIGNGRNGIRITGNNDNKFIFRNTLIENGADNIDETNAGADNSYLGNYAFSSTGANYTTAGGSVINSTAVTTSSAFSTQPAFWRNIDASP
ncbi:MAG: right-handed parallel beta-helix repeat-containing protein [Candidatus Dependentiae bacterium]